MLSTVTTASSDNFGLSLISASQPDCNLRNAVVNP